MDLVRHHSEFDRFTRQAAEGLFAHLQAGRVAAAGTPEQVARVPASYTGHYLKPLLNITIRKAV